MTQTTISVQSIIERLPGWMADWQIPGLALTIVKDDQILLEEGFGVRTLNKPEIVNRETLFAIGSCTKAFTATALGILVSEGRLEWDQPIAHFLPGWALYDPWVTANITLCDLLSHRSGLPTWGGDMIAYNSTYTSSDVLQRMRFIPPAYPFRAGFGYTNMAFLAAGQLIPAITGMEWQDFLRQRLFEPTGMRSTITNGSILDKYSNKAAPHEIIDGKICPVPYGSLDPIAPAGAIIASIHDLSKWLRLQLGNGLLDGVQIITSSVIERTRTPHTLIPILPSQRLLSPTTHFSAYGLGWFLRDYQGKLLVSHGGGVDGMLSYIAMLPEDNLGIAVLTNKLPNGLYQGLAMQVIDAFLGMPEINWSARMQEMTRQMDADQAAAQQQLENSRAKDTRPSLPPDAFAGEYHNPLYGTIILKTAGSELVAELSAHPHLRGVLEHWHYDTFLCRWNDPILRTSLMPFQTNGQGKVQSFQTKFREDWIDTVDYEFRKTD